jgi:hypothetical protein
MEMSEAQRIIVRPDLDSRVAVPRNIVANTPSMCLELLVCAHCDRAQTSRQRLARRPQQHHALRRGVSSCRRASAVRTSLSGQHRVCRCRQQRQIARAHRRRRTACPQRRLRALRSRRRDPCTRCLTVSCRRTVAAAATASRRPPPRPLRLPSPRLTAAAWCGVWACRHFAARSSALAASNLCARRPVAGRWLPR